MSDDLRWTASRYVLGELPESESAHFEALLVEDQIARDAVAEAVALIQAVATPSPVQAAPRRFPWAVPLTAVVSLSLLVGFGVYFAPSAPVADARRASADDAWILDLPELLQEQAATVEAPEPLGDEADGLVPAVAEEADAEVPGWLILATSKVGASS